MMKISKPFFGAALVLSFAACNGWSGASFPTSSAGGAQAIGGLDDLRQPASGKIKHVVIIIQENRSVDDLFTGFPGADTRSYGYDSKNHKIRLQPVPLEAGYDIDHSLKSFLQACNGSGSMPGTDCRMNGFDKEALMCLTCKPDAQYGYVPHSETKPYFAMGEQYVFADRMFTSHIDASSFTSHQYIIAGQSSSSDDFPSSLWGCGGGSTDTVPTLTMRRRQGTPVRPCFNNRTLGDELDAAGISWGYFTSALDANGQLWNAYQAIRHIRYGADWKRNVISPQTKFFKAIDDAELPAVSWVTPTCENSDHADCDSNHGPEWVASLVNAVGTSKYWNSTAIFVFWDEYGGWYDHVPPKMVDYDGLGIRVPLLVISPYAKKGYVSHVQYEHGSLLRFVEDQFGLPRLAASDERAKSPEKDCFDFSRPPRPFQTIPAALGRHDFEREPLDLRPTDTE
ncbi:MAG TPA: alkaline phosphatase family protein [Candidatus Tumulicola sp.]|jgi:phospholipase C